LDEEGRGRILGTEEELRIYQINKQEEQEGDEISENKVNS